MAERKPPVTYEAAPPHSTKKAQLILCEVVLRSDRLQIAVETHGLAETYRSARPVPRPPHPGTILRICIKESQEDR
jgi:hypothetical protein